MSEKKTIPSISMGHICKCKQINLMLFLTHFSQTLVESERPLGVSVIRAHSFFKQQNIHVSKIWHLHFEGIFLDENMYSETLKYESMYYIRKNPKINSHIFGLLGDKNKLCVLIYANILEFTFFYVPVFFYKTWNKRYSV